MSEHTYDAYHTFHTINMDKDDTLALTFTFNLGPVEVRWTTTWVAPHRIGVTGARMTVTDCNGEQSSVLGLLYADGDYCEIENPIGKWLVDDREEQETGQEVQSEDLQGRRSNGGVVRERHSHLLDQPWSGVNNLLAR